MRRIYEDPATEGILLIDASNAFNSLNRKAALNNIKYTCPEFSCLILSNYQYLLLNLIEAGDDFIGEPSSCLSDIMVLM